MADPLQIPGLNPADARMAELIFEFVQFLLDDDAHLTPTGNLTAGARQKFRNRVEELVTADEAAAALTVDASGPSEGHEPSPGGETSAAPAPATTSATGAAP